MTPRQAINNAWADRLTDGELALGLDLATTERGTSNPSSCSVLQRTGRVVVTRLIVAWKTRDDRVTKSVVQCVLDDIEAKNHKPRRLNIDASNERFFAAQLRRFFSAKVVVNLIAGNQKLQFRGEKLDAKTLLGNMYASAIEDGLITLPANDWISLDHRLVMREAGGFVTTLGPNGEHGDTFDSGKLAYWGLQSTSGSTHGVKAVQVGGIKKSHGRELQGSFNKKKTNRLNG